MKSTTVENHCCNVIKDFILHRTESSVTSSRYIGELSDIPDKFVLLKGLSSGSTFFLFSFFQQVVSLVFNAMSLSRRHQVAERTLNCHQKTEFFPTLPLLVLILSKPCDFSEP